MEGEAATVESGRNSRRPACDSESRGAAAALEERDGATERAGGTAITTEVERDRRCLPPHSGWLNTPPALNVFNRGVGARDCVHVGDGEGEEERSVASAACRSRGVCVSEEERVRDGLRESEGALSIALHGVGARGPEGPEKGRSMRGKGGGPNGRR